ncbi:MAG: hypothetical protein HYV26_03325 [Candidatus Hydrogenedentes bacterium]|nr:hypothetical protein [Candidatus Hydrogenedentota bacterium]
MYTSPISLILGFHGCDKRTGEKVLCGEIPHLSRSENAYDWLGHGIYFWEHNPERALEFAMEQRDHPRPNKPKIDEPFVVGSVIDPANCLNLLESEALRLVSRAYGQFCRISEEANSPLPQNKSDTRSGELLQRFLDCAVIETLHDLRAREDRTPYDTVRGVFEEGVPLYANSGFRSKTHVQMCVRNSACIKGYFRLLHPCTLE